MAATNEPRVRIFVNGTWTDVTTSVREAAGIVITTGQQDESAGVNPGSCRFTFDNDGGEFTPRNPRSPYFGYLNRNTPVCVMLNEITDGFGRVSASGLGSTDTGETWQSLSAGAPFNATDYSVDGDFAKHLVPVAAAYRLSYLGSTSGAPTTYNGELLLGPIYIPFTNVTVGAIEPGNVLLRMQTSTTYYMVRVTIETDESIKIALYRDGSTVIAAATTVFPAGSHVSTTPLWVRGGAFDSTIYGKVWQGTLGDEPAAWQIQATDSTYNYGYMGWRTGVAAGNTNVPFTTRYGGVTAYLSQFNGEIPDWPQEVSDDARNMTVPIEAAGILRRLNQGRATTKSSLRRYYEDEASPAPAYYAPLDEGELATQSLATIPATGGLPFTIINTGLGAYIGIDTSTEKHFGQGKIGSWLDPTLVVFGISEELVNNQDTSKTVAVVGTTWTVDFVRAGGAGTSGVFGIVEFESFGATTSGIWNILFSVADDLITVSGPSGAFVALTASSLTHKAFDGAPHHFRLVATNSGSNVAWTFHLDGTQEASGTETGRQTLDIGSIYYAGQEALTPQPTTAIGHIAVFTSDASLQLATVITRMGGTTQELADERFERICNENNIANFVTTSGGEEMGPQFRDTLLDQFTEIVATDGGIMRELLSARALHFDPRSLLLNRTTALTLNVGNGETAPPFKPVDDDQILRNKITASKRNGGQFTYELATGRLGTADPKDGGSGVYDEEIKANPYSESQLPYIAERAVAAGTVNESRFPAVRVNLMSNGIARNLTLRRQVLNTFVSSRITLTNMSDFHVYTDADLLVVGLSKILTPSRHEIEFTCLPFAPYRAFVLDTDRLDTETSTLTSGIAASGVTTFQVSDSSGSLWTTAGGDFPLTVFVGGEPITISAISGASSPQTFTVSARTSAATTHAAGTAVSLASPTPLG